MQSHGPCAWLCATLPCIPLPPFTAQPAAGIGTVPDQCQSTIAVGRIVERKNSIRAWAKNEKLSAQARCGVVENENGYPLQAADAQNFGGSFGWAGKKSQFFTFKALFMAKTMPHNETARMPMTIHAKLATPDRSSKIPPITPPPATAVFQAVVYMDCATSTDSPAKRDKAV